MKKVFIIFTLALGAVHAEINLSDLTHLTSQQESIEFTMPDTSSAYASVILSQEAISRLKAADSINQMLFAFNQLDGNATEHVGVAVSTYSGDSSIRLTSGLTGTSPIDGGSTYYTSWTAANIGDFFGNARYAVLTLGITGSGSDQLVLTTVNNEGDVSNTVWAKNCNHSSFTYDGNVSGFSINAGSGLVTEGFVGTGGWTSQELQELGTRVAKMLPEPTTAAFSLLAMAALAARRRRK